MVTQDAADVLGSDLGRAVVANAATQILMRQAPQAIDQVAEAFHLSDGERAFLLSAERGQALPGSRLAAGRLPGHRLPGRIPADHHRSRGPRRNSTTNQPLPDGDIPLEHH